MPENNFNDEKDQNISNDENNPNISEKKQSYNNFEDEDNKSYYNTKNENQYYGNQYGQNPNFDDDDYNDNFSDEEKNHQEENFHIEIDNQKIIDFKNTSSTIGNSLLFLAIFSNIISLLVTIVFMVNADVLPNGEFANPNMTLYIVLRSSIGSFLIYAITFLVFYNKNEYPITWENRDSKLKWFFLGIGLMLAANIIVSLVSALISDSLGTSSVNADSLSSSNLFIDIITIGVIPGIGEEIFFRGIIFRYLRKYNSKMAIIASSLVFAIAHMNITQGIFAFIAGVVLATAYEQTGKLAVPMLIHATNNILAVMGLYENAELVSLIMIILSASALIYLVASKVRKTLPKVQGKMDKKLLKTFLTSPLVLTYLILYIIGIIGMMMKGII